MSFKDLDDGNVNHKLNLSNSFENNCSLSVYAGEARARGLDVEALGVTLPKKGKTTIAYQLGEDRSCVILIRRKWSTMVSPVQFAK